MQTISLLITMKQGYIIRKEKKKKNYTHQSYITCVQIFRSAKIIIFSKHISWLLLIESNQFTAIKFYYLTAEGYYPLLISSLLINSHKAYMKLINITSFKTRKKKETFAQWQLNLTRSMLTLRAVNFFTQVSLSFDLSCRLLNEKILIQFV